MMLTLCFPGLMIVGKPLYAQAWTRDWPQPGDAVRVTSNLPSFHRERMTFAREINDTLVFARMSGLSRARLETPIARANLMRLEMPGIPSRSHRTPLLGAIAGFAGGAAIGGTLAYFTTDMSCRETDTCNPEFGPEFNRAVGTTLGIVAGGLVGGVTGWAIGRRSLATWRDVLPRH